MTSWKEIQNEIDATKSQEKPSGDFDSIRRGKYKLLADLTGRSLIVYATAFHNPIKAQVAAPFLSIDLSDKDGFKEVTQRLKFENSEGDVLIRLTVYA